MYVTVCFRYIYIIHYKLTRKKKKTEIYFPLGDCNELTILDELNAD